VGSGCCHLGLYQASEACDLGGYSIHDIKCGAGLRGAWARASTCGAQAVI
jgi:hypothetical protein